MPGGDRRDQEKGWNLSWAVMMSMNAKCKHARKGGCQNSTSVTQSIAAGVSKNMEGHNVPKRG